jgi:uncharacterized protein
MSSDPEEADEHVADDGGMPSFEWHPFKAESNRRKHGVTFEEAKTIFSDLLRIEAPDDWHSDDEQRFLGIGRTNRDRIVSVYYTFRSNKIRIISARCSERWERDAYETANDEERN